MLSNYFTFLQIARHLNERLTGSVIANAYSQEKNTLSLLLYLPEPYTLTISCTARQNYIVGKEGALRSKRNSIDLFPSLTDAHIEHVYLDSSDRSMIIRISGPRYLVVDMFGAKANVTLYSDAGIALDTFLKKKNINDEPRPIQKEPNEISFSTLFPPYDECVHLFKEDDVPVVKRLRTIVPKLGPILADEIVFRSSVSTDSLSTELSPETFRSIYRNTESIVNALCKNTSDISYIYFEGNSPVTFSIIPLESRRTLQCEEYPDIFAGIRRFIGTSRSESSFEQLKKQLIGWISKELQRDTRTVKKIESESTESSRAETYQLYGSLLIAHSATIEKGAARVSLANSFAAGEEVTIPLERSLSAIQNAERYFDKAKKSRSARAESADRIESLRKRIGRLSELYSAAEVLTDGNSFKKFLHSHTDILHTLGYMTEKEQAELPPFKIFTVDGGFAVYAGKSSDNNDLLTVKFAKPNDLWFHARGSSGSHVVLKTGSSTGIPSKKAIEEAASIAAYYSKMKNAKNVPVAMTEKKYVRKPKGAPSGTVVIEREKVIFVQPRLPQDQ